MSDQLERLKESLKTLKSIILKNKLEGKASKIDYFNTHLNVINDSLLSEDIEIINAARFGLENLLQYDNQLVNGMLAFNLYNLSVDIIGADLEYKDIVGDIPNPNDESFKDVIKNEYEKLIEKKGDSGISLLDFHLLDLDSYPENELKGILGSIIGVINDPALTYENGITEAQVNTMQMIFLMKLLKMKDKFQLTYYFAGQITDKLNFHNDYQLSRDFSENFLHIALREKSDIALAHFVLGVTTVRQNNIFLSLMHLNAFIHGIKNRNDLDMHFHLRGLKEVLKVLRNMKMFKFEKILFEEIVKSGKFKGWNYHEVHHIHYTGLLTTGEANLPSEIYRFLLGNMEDIISKGHHGAMGWYNTLLQLRNIYEDVDQFEPLINQFRIMLTPDQRSKIDRMHSFDPEDLKKRIVEEIVKLTKTRSSKDLKSDLYIASFLGHQAIWVAFKNQDTELFLLGIAIVSDFSISQESTEAVGANYKIDNSLEATYYSDEEVLKLLSRVKDLSKVEPGVSFFSIGRNQNHLFSLEMKDSQANIQKVTNKRDEVATFLESNREELVYKDSIKVGNINYPVEPWQYEEILTSFIKKLPKIVFNANGNSCLLARDNDISSYPHNFLLNQSNDLLIKSNAIANVMSFLLYEKRKWSQAKPIDLSQIELWTPVEDGDPGLNKVLNDFYPVLGRFSKYDVSTIPRSPLLGNINIVIAHGAQDINSASIFHSGAGHAITDMRAIFGEGKIAILFVCHSGSEKSSRFDQSVESLARKLISNGYEAVIAPFWSLNIAIPPVWLPVFLDSMDKGKKSLEAFYDGSMAVKAVNPHPGAWLCLHYFGNPNLVAGK